MSSVAAQDQIDMAMSHVPKVATPRYEADEKAVLAHASTRDSFEEPVEFDADLVGEEPTEEEIRTLPRVSGQIPWQAFTIAFVELCERFGYYGCSVMCMFDATLIWYVTPLMMF
jgi:POT family proton-dependent oligopeptide transporter